RADKFGAPAVNHVAQVSRLTTLVVSPCNASRAFAAAYQWRQQDFLPNANRRDFCADLRDFSGYVATGNMRKRNRNIWQSRADPQIKMIQRASTHSHKHFV